MASILFIEDDEPLRKAISRLLTRTGYEVIEAQNGRVALTAMSRQPADLVITNILMPEMDGIEVIRFLRREFPATPIVAVSGDGRISAGHYLEIARKLGAHKCLAKPFSPWELLDAVSELLARSGPGGPDRSILPPRSEPPPPAAAS